MLLTIPLSDLATSSLDVSLDPIRGGISCYCSSHARPQASGMSGNASHSPAPARSILQAVENAVLHLEAIQQESGHILRLSIACQNQERPSLSQPAGSAQVSNTLASISALPSDDIPDQGSHSQPHILHDAPCDNISTPSLNLNANTTPLEPPAIHAVPQHDPVAMQLHFPLFDTLPITPPDFQTFDPFWASWDVATQHMMMDPLSSDWLQAAESLDPSFLRNDLETPIDENNATVPQTIELPSESPPPSASEVASVASGSVTRAPSASPEISSPSADTPSEASSSPPSTVASSVTSPVFTHASILNSPFVNYIAPFTAPSPSSSSRSSAPPQTPNGGKDVSSKGKDKERPDKNGQYACLHPGCTKATASPSARRMHMKSHQPKRRYSCTICAETFTRDHDRMRHEVTQHQKPCEYVCPTCSRFFSNQKMLDRHTCRTPRNGNLRWPLQIPSGFHPSPAES